MIRILWAAAVLFGLLDTQSSQTAVSRALVRLQDLVTAGEGAGHPINSTITAHIDGSGNVTFAGTGTVQIRGNLIDKG